MGSKRPRSDECPIAQNLKYDTIYHVNVAGHTFLIEGNEVEGKFRWRNHPDNDCLGQNVVLFSRIGMMQARFEDGVYRWVMAFENHGRGYCHSLAFLLYLCAAGYSNVNMTMTSLLKMLTSYIQEHIDDPKGPRLGSYRKFFASYRVGVDEMIERCSLKQRGLTEAHSDAFANLFDVPVRTFEVDYDSIMKRHRTEWGDYSGEVFNKLGPAHFRDIIIPSTYTMAYVTDTNVCNLLWLNPKPGDNTAHVVLLGLIEREEPLVELD